MVNVLKCRPPGNRDPLPQEIDNCQDYLFRQLELIQPKVVCTLGNFATKLLRADPSTGITKLHGREEVRVIGPRAVRLFPIYHPAAALYTRSLLDTLRADFARLPELLALDPPPQPEPPGAGGPGARDRRGDRGRRAGRGGARALAARAVLTRSAASQRRPSGEEERAGEDDRAGRSPRTTMPSARRSAAPRG